MSQFTEDNRKYFNDQAKTYDTQPWQQAITATITAFLQAPEQLAFINAKWLPSADGPVKLLDYACGTGMLSRAFGPYVSKIVAVDLSANMVARYKELASSSTLDSVQHAIAMVGNLLTDEEALRGEDLHDFDVAGIGLGVHHFADPELAIDKLAGRLKQGGVLLIVDFIEEHGVRLPGHASHTVHRHGFKEDEMKTMMESKGLSHYGWKEMPGTVEMKPHGADPIVRRVFVARATKR